MSASGVIVLMALVTFGPRLAGFALAGREVPPFWLRFLHFVPISTFAVLIVPALPGVGGLPARVGAAALAALLMWRWRNLPLGILGGFAAYWLLRLL